MAVEIDSRVGVARALDARPEVVVGAGPIEAEAELGPGRSVAAAAVSSVALVLVLAPAAIAAMALVAPDVLNRAAAWLLGGALAFSLVAAGRVPAATLIALAWRSRAGP